MIFNPGGTRKRVVPDYSLGELEIKGRNALQGADRFIDGLRVDVESVILGHYRIDIEPFHGLKACADCYAFGDTTGKRIFVDADLMDDERSEKKYRFTLAEELSHILIHQSVYGGCRTADERIAAELRLGEAEVDRLETNAKALAGMILMPKPHISDLTDETIEKLIKKHRHIPADALVQDIAAKCDVNYSCAKLRLKSLGYHHKLRLNLN